VDPAPKKRGRPRKHPPISAEERIQEGKRFVTIPEGGMDALLQKGRSLANPPPPFQEMKMRLMLSSIAPSTTRGYALSWRQWERFCCLRGESPILYGSDRVDIRREEEQMLDFAVHLAGNLGRAASTVKSKMMGIRFRHVAEGWGDCLKDKPRIWLLLRALKKRGGVQRKWPVTAQMLIWIKGQLDMTQPDDVVLWADLCMAWLFLLRAGEHISHDGRGYDLAKVMLGSCLSFRRAGVAVEQASDADEIGLFFRSSKADHYNSGEHRNHTRGGEICALEAIAKMQALLPERFGKGAESELPLFRRSNGRPLLRSYVQGWLAKAAAAGGYSAERFGSHSLRIGGATAMLHMGYSVDMIKRMGRWVSDSFHAYLWESSDDSKGLAKAMSGDTSALMASRSR